MRALLFILLLWSTLTYGQEKMIPEYYQTDSELEKYLMEITDSLGLLQSFDVGSDGTEEISLAVIDLNQQKPTIAGVHMHNFIYPASVYKMYVAAEVLNQIEQDKYSLETMIKVSAPNDVDRSKEIKSDPRPLLKDGDSVSVNYLLDLMITRSDNSASNCLIDLAKRENINATIQKNGWVGSEVTRKFLSRKYEDPGYEKIRSTETNALHAADFYYKMFTETLISPWVSRQIKTFLGRQLDTQKLVLGLSKDAIMYHKSGWWSYWTHDVGLVSHGKKHYIISCFLPLKEPIAKEKMRLMARAIQQFFNARYDQK